ncbi:MAG: hypothetical protein ACSHWZ_12055 [Sulfitobacter sp.]
MPGTDKFEERLLRMKAESDGVVAVAGDAPLQEPNAAQSVLAQFPSNWLLIFGALGFAVMTSLAIHSLMDYSSAVAELEMGYITQ